MKKFVTVFSLLVLAAGVLAGCNSKKGGGGKKGKEPDENAWSSIWNQSIFNGASAAYDDSDNPVKPEMSKGTAPYARLALSSGVRPQFSTDYFEATFEYKYSVTVGGEEKNVDDYIEDQLDHDIVDAERKKTHTVRIVAFKGWPDMNTEEANYPRFTIDATAKVNGYTQSKSYTMVLYPSTYTYHTCTIADLYTKHSSLDALQFMRKKANSEGIYECDSGDPSNTYYNVITQGKLIYVTEDNNWGILQDGDKYVELYHLDIPVMDSIKEHLVGKNIWVKGQLGFGYGNIQISSITSILPIKDGDSSHPVIAPAAEKSFSESDFNNKSWWTNPMFNAVGSISTAAKVKDGKIYSVVNASGGASTERKPADNASASSCEYRYEFDVEVGSTTIVVATDYHACCGYESKGNPGSETEAFDNLLKNLTAGQTINLKGTIRWLNSRDKSGGNDHCIYDDGAWTITPYLGSHIQ